MVYYVYDCETFKWKKSMKTNDKIPFRFAVLSKCENDKISESWRITKIEDLFNILFDEYEKIGKIFRIYIHNLGFDAKYFYSYLNTHYKYDLIYNNSELKISVYNDIGKRRKTFFEFRDSLILFYLERGE